MRESVVLVLAGVLATAGLVFAETKRGETNSTHSPPKPTPATVSKPASPAPEKPLLLEDEKPLLRLGEEKAPPTPSKTPPASMNNLKTPAKDKLLLLDDDKPLLLRDEEKETNALTGPVADNSRCQVCHLNIFLEEITVTHAKGSIGCAKCHGECDAHIADESWASGGNGTAPEIMYPKHKINRLCRDCHQGPKMIANKPSKPCPKLSGAFTVQKYCTDCHGKHRLVERKCKWK